jgi:hypothetical protein
MGRNSKNHQREYDKKVVESGLPPSHPTNEEIFGEYDLIGGIILTKKEKFEKKEKKNRASQFIF